jgi:hypothetical protein
VKKLVSQIASFYTFEKNMAEALLEAAVPRQQIIKKKILFFNLKTKQTVDNYWNFIKEHGTDQEAFGYSGTGFTDLELLLEEKGINLYKFGAGEFARQLSAARPSVLAVFDQAAARDTINLLNETELSKDEAQKYSQENFPHEDDAVVAESILSAYDIFKWWLASVTEAEIGVLDIG